MITPAYVRTMAAYNAEMNRRWYQAAASLADEERRRDRGAFFGSIHATLAHLVWADQIWMSRFDGWPAPKLAMRAAIEAGEPFDTMHAARLETDRALEAWAARLDDDWLAGELTWFSGATQREYTKRRDLLVAHLFNHQTHHRGQVHAMLTAAGAKTGDTDLPFVL
jgi:uncharacterized damage-inducible protein DinB